MMKQLFGFTNLVPVILMFGAANVQAENTCSTGFLKGVFVDDNVVVDASSGGGAGICNINTTTITGDLKVEAGGFATVFQSNIRGNAQLDFGVGLQIALSTVVGNVQIKGASFGSGISNSTVVNGNVQLEENRSLTSVLSTTVVNGDVQAFNNIGRASIGDNKLNNGNLQCEGNVPPPSNLAFPNTVLNGEKEGQCAGL